MDANFNRSCRGMRALGKCYLLWDLDFGRFTISFTPKDSSRKYHRYVTIGYYDQNRFVRFTLFDYTLSRYSEDRGRLIYGGNYMRTKNKKYELRHE